MLQDNWPKISLDAVFVERKERQRREVKTNGLVDSIRQLGVLQPIIVEGAAAPFRLVAGERRLAAAREAGLLEIPFRNYAELTIIERQIIELEENIKRTDLPWQDLVAAVGRIHQLFQQQEEDWYPVDTGAICSLSEGTIRLYLQVAQHLGDERISGCATVREAWGILKRRDQREAGDALAELVGLVDEMLPSPAEVEAEMEALAAEVIPLGAEGVSQPARKVIPLAPRVEDCILQESFLQWAPRYSGPKFNLVHCDFPYGIGLFGGPLSGGRAHGDYQDTEETYFTLLDCFLTHRDRFMSISSHLMFWFSEKHRTETLRRFASQAPDIQFYPFPLIWVKSDNSGIAADMRRHPRHIYETALFGVRQGRNVVRTVSDAYSAPTDKTFHVSCKPEPVLKYFLGMMVDENSRLLDPTCGSGSALRAAEALGAQRVLGMDIDEETVGKARQALRLSRAKYSASRAPLENIL